MDGPTIHFAPRQQRLSRLAPASAPPLLSVTALAGVPEFVRNRFGDKVVRAANRAARIDIEAIEDRDCFIPHATMTTFLSTVARRAGEPDLGLLLAPHLSLDAYGCWGRYVLDGADLHAAIARSMEAIGYHSRGDRSVLRLHGAQAQFCYVSAARGREGYAHVAVGAVGVMLSLCRAYLPPSWRPLRIELDIPRPDRPSRFEDTFQCPVSFDAPVASVWFEARLLAVERQIRSANPLLTLHDVARARLDPSSRDGLVGVVAAHIRAQVLSGSLSIDSTALALEMSTRSLQRALHDDGTDFRSLASVTRARRARELLAGSRASVSEIATELGYSTPANFARAFRKETGMSPSAFRRVTAKRSG